MSYTFHVPTKVLFGPGVLKKLHEEKLPGMAPLARKAVGMLFSCDPSELSDDDVLAILRASYR